MGITAETLRGRANERTQVARKHLAEFAQHLERDPVRAMRFADRAFEAAAMLLVSGDVLDRLEGGPVEEVVEELRAGTITRAGKIEASTSASHNLMERETTAAYAWFADRVRYT